MRRTPLLAFVLTAAVAGTAVPAAAGAAPPDRWARSVGFTERVVSSPVAGGGYPGESPAPGGCVAGRYDANFAESTLAAQPGTERLRGGAQAAFDRPGPVPPPTPR